MKIIIALLLVPCFLQPFGWAQDKASRAEDTGGNWALSFEELVALSSRAKPSEELSARLEHLLTSPIVDNTATAEAVTPHQPAVQGLGSVVRVGLWNIERGLNFELIRSALTDTNEYENLAGNIRPAKFTKNQIIESQMSSLQNADVLILNEVDSGMKRTDYRDVARELAAALHMNYAYGVEFVEVDPVFELGTEKVHLPEAPEDQRLQQDLQVDRARYRGLHGTTILSRYPIRSARILRLQMCYDWFNTEAKKVAQIERGKRWAAHQLFKERVEREIRRGGRMALIADLTIPGSPTGEVTVVATHLENRCAPECRRRQLDELLAKIKDDGNPVVIAGDFNTTARNNTPTSLRNEIMSRVTDYRFWIGQAVSYFHPLGIFQHALFPLHYLHGYNDPTVLHVPILWENRERPFFGDARNFRFADGAAFDLLGDPKHALQGRERTLSDSNQRAGKGFVPTYAFARDYAGLVGRFKLDWILVKPVTRNSRQDPEVKTLSPYFPQTMRELNESVSDRIADHAPMTVDLPLGGGAVVAGRR